jgi:endonuclease-3 related protein
VADEYLRRIAERHGLVTPAPGRNRRGYEALVSLTREGFALDPAEKHKRLFNEFHALTVAVGKAHCRRRANCDGCPLAPDIEGAGEPA